MHDSEFEKQVQQKMQELKFAPGTDVWSRVQADLQKKKRRRPVILWFLLAGLLVGGSWILYTTVLDKGQPGMYADAEKTNRHSQQEQSSTIYPDNAAKENNINPNEPSSSKQPDKQVGIGSSETVNKSINKSSDNLTNKSSDKSLNKSTGRVTNNSSRKTNPAPELIINSGNTTATNRAVAKSSVDKRTINRPVQTSETNAGVPIVNNLKKNAVESPVTNSNQKSNKDDAAVKKNDVAIAKDNIAKENNNTLRNEPIALKENDPLTSKKEQNTALKDQPETPITNPAAVKKDERVAMKNKKQNSAAEKTRWQFGVTAGAGISDLGRQFFKPATVADFALSNTSPMSPNPPYRRPSEVEAGTSWHAGVYAQRNIGKKFALKLGVNYELYSNSIKVGSQVNSARFVNQGTDMKIVEEYFTTGTTTNYDNKYNFLSVPVSVQWKVFDRKKYGIVWENGVNVSSLLKTTALHFDGISGTYYKDDNIFKKKQFMLSSSVLFTVKAKNNLQLYAGPHVQYGISNLVNEKAGNNRHLRYAGLKLTAGFNKK